MTAAEFTTALELLGWTQGQAALELGVGSPEKPAATRINAWANGKRKVPRYIAAHVATHLRLVRLRATAEHEINRLRARLKMRPGTFDLATTTRKRG